MGACSTSIHDVAIGDVAFSFLADTRDCAQPAACRPSA
jgi:hypothetical protein